MIVVYNGTPDTIPWTHGGISGKLKPGDWEKWEDARAKFVLNGWGQRGLVRLDYGDKVEDKRAESMRLYKEFWFKQITRFNQENEIRRNENKPYNFPGKELTKHAEEFGVEVMGPWTMKETESTKVAALEAENKELRSKFDQMNRNMEMLLAKFDGGTKAVEETFKDPMEGQFLTEEEKQSEKIEGLELTEADREELKDTLEGLSKTKDWDPNTLFQDQQVKPAEVEDEEPDDETEIETDPKEFVYDLSAFKNKKQFNKWVEENKQFIIEQDEETKADLRKAWNKYNKSGRRGLPAKQPPF